MSTIINNKTECFYSPVLKFLLYSICSYRCMSIKFIYSLNIFNMQALSSESFENVMYTMYIQ